MSTVSFSPQRITIPYLLQKKLRREKITMLTAYDYPSAILLDQSELDVVLVGDSLGMVMLGHESTLPVTMEEMIHHCRAVSRGLRRAMLVGDMPYGSYQNRVSEAVSNGTRFIKEAGCSAVKLEGGRGRARAIAALVEAEVPVMAHIGMTPQSVHRFGGFRVQGKSVEAAEALMEDAYAVQEAGAFSVVLESIPSIVAAEITTRLHIPTIGIGAGVHCDGQVLVWHDLIGLLDGTPPKFVKQYLNLHQQILKAVNTYCEEVESGLFPGSEHIYSMPDAELFEERVREAYGNHPANPSNEGAFKKSKV
jgi:3-methyl-2-oxobutanoate hydroxymethyltransferase